MTIIMIFMVLLAVSSGVSAQSDSSGIIDTIYVEPYKVDAKNWAVEISMVNDEDIIALCIPLKYSGGSSDPVVADSVVFDGARAENFRFKWVTIDTAAQSIIIGLMDDRRLSPPIPPGKGPVATVYISSLNKENIAYLSVDSMIIDEPYIELQLVDAHSNDIYPAFVVRSVADVKYEYDQILPKAFSLFPNYPNPFNSETTIRFEIRARSFITLSVIDIEGREVVRLMEQSAAAGQYNVRWDGRNELGGIVASGVYIIHLKSGGFDNAIKAILLK